MQTAPQELFCLVGEQPHQHGGTRPEPRRHARHHWGITNTVAALQNLYAADPDGAAATFGEFADVLAMGGAGGDDVLALLRAQGDPGGDGFAQLLGNLGAIATTTGDAGGNVLYGKHAANTLLGMGGADRLYGGDGADTLDGGTGDDNLEGGWGEDIYEFGRGGGKDVIFDIGGEDTLRFGEGIAAGGITLTRDGYDLVLGAGGAGDRVTVMNFGADQGDRIERVEFADGTIWDAGYLQELAAGIAPAGTDGPDKMVVWAGIDSVLDGLGGNDTLAGYNGADTLTGGGGTDILDGGGGNDTLYAESEMSVAEAIAAGNIPNSGTGERGDWLSGVADNDTLIGSAGNDVLTGGGGADLLIAGAGDDDIFGDADLVATSFDWTVTDHGDGSRWFSPVYGNQYPADGGADTIYAGEGKDFVSAGIGSDTIFGGGGADRLYGEDGNDYLDGGADKDVISGNAGDDTIIGGAGDDTLYGGEGQDTFIYNRGDGSDTLYDILGENNTLRFGEGIGAGDITLRLASPAHGLGSLMLDLGPSTGSGQVRDAIHIMNMHHRAPTALEVQAGLFPDGVDVLTGFDRNDVFNSASIGSFEFAPAADGQDGTTLTLAELLARGFDLDGTDTADTILGTNATDRINGGGGRDILNGGEGDDTLAGGTGDDILSGGKGDDTYLYNIGDGLDFIGDAGGADTLRFGAGILPGNITFTKSGPDITLVIGGADLPGQAPDQVTIRNWGAARARASSASNSRTTPARYGTTPNSTRALPPHQRRTTSVLALMATKPCKGWPVTTPCPDWVARIPSTAAPANDYSGRRQGRRHLPVRPRQRAGRDRRPRRHPRQHRHGATGGGPDA